MSRGANIVFIGISGCVVISTAVGIACKKASLSIPQEGDVDNIYDGLFSGLVAPKTYNGGTELIQNLVSEPEVTPVKEHIIVNNPKRTGWEVRVASVRREIVEIIGEKKYSVFERAYKKKFRWLE